MKARWIVSTGVTVAIAATVTVVTLQSSDGKTATAATPAKTATLSTRSISNVDKYDGTFKYDAIKDIAVDTKGVVTKARAVGDVVEQGGALVWVDNEPVTLLYGSLPQWRPLKAGMDEGPDVKQLEQALVDLGYAKGLGLTVDNSFTSVTTTAVKRMQDALGLEEDGVVDAGEIVFLSGPARVTSVIADVGDPVGQSVVQVSSTKRVVELSLEASDRSALANGQTVSVELPDGKTFEGTVRSVATTVTTDKNSQDSKETVDVIIDVPDGTDVAYDQSPVSVSASTELAKDVMTAPVSALLAIAGGGYAVERVTATGTEMVPVELGAFGDSYVEIKGNVKPGDKVVVAS